MLKTNTSPIRWWRLSAKNGAGKSTLFKLLTGLLTPQTGVIKIDGENFNDLKPVEKLLKVGITFQNPDDQLFNPTVQREVEWNVAQVIDDHDTITRRALAALKRVGLDDKTAESPYDLSLSERKLLSVATVLAVDPAIYLFDEPMMSLDWESRRKLTAIFHQLADSGHQVVTITMTWIGSPPSLSRCMLWNTGSLASLAVHGNCSAITNLSSEWDYYHRGLWT